MGRGYFSFRLGRLSALTTKGLISRMGVPSSMSMPRTCSTFWSLANSSSTDNPIGLRRLGEQMLNTPRGAFRWGGFWLRDCALKAGLL